ncbi:MAG: hypothetical protein EOP11_23175 [Proteobacteria bacterium]|nr:MAG: hypothetical protein EOP11_23175 [Pseudomonadota bacterium]
MKLFLLAALLLTSSSAQAANAESLYNDMAGEGLTIQYTSEGRAMVGSNIVEKSAGDVICQKATVVAPNAQPNFRCFQKLLSGKTAKGTFEAGEANELTVNYYGDGLPLVGSITRHKFIGNGFCRAKSAVIARLVYSYGCYSEIN